MSERSMSNEVQNQLEAIIDGHGLGLVLTALANICAEKSWHVAEVWQDTSLANQWLKAAVELDNLSCHSTIESVS